MNNLNKKDFQIFNHLFLDSLAQKALIKLQMCLKKAKKKCI